MRSTVEPIRNSTRIKKYITTIMKKQGFFYCTAIILFAFSFATLVIYTCNNLTTCEQDVFAAGSHENVVNPPYKVAASQALATSSSCNYLTL